MSFLVMNTYRKNGLLDYSLCCIVVVVVSELHRFGSFVQYVHAQDLLAIIYGSLLELLECWSLEILGSSGK
jgi:hypothetical protein